MHLLVSLAYCYSRASMCRWLFRLIQNDQFALPTPSAKLRRHFTTVRDMTSAFLMPVCSILCCRTDLLLLCLEHRKMLMCLVFHMTAQFLIALCSIAIRHLLKVPTFRAEREGYSLLFGPIFVVWSMSLISSTLFHVTGTLPSRA